MRDAASLLDHWQGADATLPRLTWYDGDERVELSGRVLANWVIKAANLLAEDAEVHAGSVVAVHLPMHWRSLVWSLAAWLLGARVVPGTDPGTGPASGTQDAEPDADPDVVLTTDPGDAATGAHLILIALPALAMSVPGPLPAGATDGAADLMTYPDVLTVPTAPRDLRAMASPGPGAERWAVNATSPRALADTLGVWLAGGSVVLIRDEAEMARIAGIEGARHP